MGFKGYRQNPVLRFVRSDLAQLIGRFYVSTACGQGVEERSYGIVRGNTRTHTIYIIRTHTSGTR